MAVSSDDDLLDYLRAMNIWDSVGFLETEYNGYSTRIFGNANVGQLNLCNLQVPGQIAPGDYTAFVMNWYARTSLPPSPEFALYLAQTYATFVVGDRPRWCAPLSDLFDRVASRAPRWPEVVPARQNVSVALDTFGGASDALRVQDEWSVSSFNNRNGRVWIHLEGITMPRELWLRDEDSTDAAQVRARYLAMQARVLRLLTSARSQKVDTAEHIARWISSMADDDSPGELRAQMDALADAVREGRWRPEKKTDRGVTEILDDALDNPETP